jgi:transposase
VNRPNRQARSRDGKSDPADAEAAARATLARDAIGVPKSQDGAVEVIRILRLERRSAIYARTQEANQLHAVVSTAPEPLRADLRKLSLAALLDHARKLRKVTPMDAVSATQSVLRGLAKRWQCLDREVDLLDEQLESLAKKTAPNLLGLRGVGVEVACALLVAAGDNPERLAQEASFAALCGVSPIDASSGRQHRLRLNRGRNRDANRALWGHRSCPTPLRPSNAHVRGAPHSGGPRQAGNPAVFEALHRSRSLQDPKWPQARERTPTDFRKSCLTDIGASMRSPRASSERSRPSSPSMRTTPPVQPLPLPSPITSRRSTTCRGDIPSSITSARSNSN